MRDTQPNMLRSDVLHLVRFVENHKIISEEDPAFDRLLQSAQQGEKQGMVENQDIGRENAVASTLKKADLVGLPKLRGITAHFRGAQASLGTDLPPDFGIGFHLEIRQAPVGG